jgi:hypothetical protein
VKLVRVLIAAAAALTTAVVIQVGTSSGASASETHTMHTNDCLNCWYIVGE